MVAGTSIVVHNLVVCNNTPVSNMFGLVMYVSYMVLFTKLYIDSYVSAKSRAPREKSAVDAPAARKKME
jgi:hypothetical protein